MHRVKGVITQCQISLTCATCTLGGLVTKDLIVIIGLPVIQLAQLKTDTKIPPLRYMRDQK